MKAASVLMGEALNGPDERSLYLCVFGQCLPCLTNIKPFFPYDSKCQTVLEPADWCLWEVALYVLADKMLKVEESSIVKECYLNRSVTLRQRYKYVFVS